MSVVDGYGTSDGIPESPLPLKPEIREWFVGREASIVLRCDYSTNTFKIFILPSSLEAAFKHRWIDQEIVLKKAIQIKFGSDDINIDWSR